MGKKGYFSRRTVLAAGAAVTASLAGCASDAESGPTETPSDTPKQTEANESEISKTGCQTPGDDLTAVFPDSEEYTLNSTETFSDNSPYGIQSAIGVYDDVGGSRYEFLVIEFEDATTAQEKATEVASENEYAETGYLTAEQYFYGLAGENRDVITALIGASAPLTECVEDNLQFQ